MQYIVFDILTLFFSFNNKILNKDLFNSFVVENDAKI